MKTLIVFYSRSGRTRTHMVSMREPLGGERLIALRARRPYSGIVGALRATREGIGKRETELQPLDSPPDMSEYDLVVLGTPVWAGHIASPLRTFLTQYGGSIRRCAYVITHGGQDAYEKVFDELDSLTGVRRVAELSLRRDDKDAKAKQESFVKTLLKKIS